MPVDTTGPFPADPNTGQRAVADAATGAMFYYPDEPKPGPGYSYSLIQRSPGNTMQAVSQPAPTVTQQVESVIQDVVGDSGPVPAGPMPVSASVTVPGTVMAPYPSAPSTSSSSPTIEEAVTQERKKSTAVTTGGSGGGGGISVPWMDIAQGFSAAGQAAAPVLQTQAALLALRAGQQRGVQFVPTPVYQQQSRDWGMLLVGGTVVVAAGIFLLYALKRK